MTPCVIHSKSAGHITTSIFFVFSEYGQFKTFVAQETDWLERLEKKLRRPTHSAADAEEISEELNEIENFLDNHPEARLQRIRELAESLTKSNILILDWLEDARRLQHRWDELRTRAKKRTTVLETAIAEAQEWYILISEQTVVKFHSVLGRQNSIYIYTQMSLFKGYLILCTGIECEPS